MTTSLSCCHIWILKAVCILSTSRLTMSFFPQLNNLYSINHFSWISRPYIIAWLSAFNLWMLGSIQRTEGSNREKTTRNKSKTWNQSPRNYPRTSRSKGISEITWPFRREMWRYLWALRKPIVIYLLEVDRGFMQINLLRALWQPQEFTEQSQPSPQHLNFSFCSKKQWKYRLFNCAKAHFKCNWKWKASARCLCLRWCFIWEPIITRKSIWELGKLTFSNLLSNRNLFAANQ
jgi:hypothetical protein